MKSGYFPSMDWFGFSIDFCRKKTNIGGFVGAFNGRGRAPFQAVPADAAFTWLSRAFWSQFVGSHKSSDKPRFSFVFWGFFVCFFLWRPTGFFCLFFFLRLRTHPHRYGNIFLKKKTNKRTVCVCLFVCLFFSFSSSLEESRFDRSSAGFFSFLSFLSFLSFFSFLFIAVV